MLLFLFIICKPKLKTTCEAVSATVSAIVASYLEGGTGTMAGQRRTVSGLWTKERTWCCILWRTATSKTVGGYGYGHSPDRACAYSTHVPH